mmetsp:Transcript_29082/g.56893  ORF Transcript_29082/g.56893 Transcript_29082/m.56893 type:complete len:324 (-) Transcript_29082:79-1050(-)|eukprot:CAMPEP_0173390482 /NCGR_PEP_ID=MMETSP1356-20130122/15002_1 /TAXON_ID=77927 ORGANISM="Hemiselmis virescens, Strain PCC157" /NCGR_SAMPLE_ID=MMETSP1356 /ASSEMBLY_ACC=CAM_ASM_000847 /LENGTH=323 /DNA_ID=CAMNT_0014347883 /DNA_START=20 /DNA_END=991 /DNA_ORIENTATION=-
MAKDPKALREHFQGLLSAKKAGDLPIEREPLFIPFSTPPLDGFKFLAGKGIRACPVLGDDNKILGTLDLRDSCGFICQLYEEAQHAAGKKGSFVAQGTKAKIVLDDLDVRGVAKKREFRTFGPDTSLLDVALALATGSHIVGIEGGPESQGGLSRVVTQGILLKFVAPELENLKIPVKACMTSPAVALKWNDPALKGFELMATKGISSIAIVEEQGQIIHNMSASDVKLYFGVEGHEGDKDLSQEMEDYLAKKSAGSAKSKARAPISVCKESDDLHNVVTKLVKTGYHRVWVVKEKKPVGVLSLTDVFKKLVTNEKDDNCCIL